MAFIVKGKVFGKVEEPVEVYVPQPVLPPEPVEEIKKDVVDVKVTPPPTIKVKVEKYKHVHDGELHKLINRKSGYVCDMLNLIEE